MSRTAKLLLAGAALALAVLIGAATIAWRSLDLGRVAALVGDRVTAASGRDFAIKGALRIRVFPRLAVVAGDVHLGNAPWGSRQDMLRLPRVEAEVALWPLLRGRVEIRRVVLVEPDVWLETDRAGIGNWVLHRGAEPAAGAPATKGAAPRITLGRLRLEGARIGHRDGRTGRTTRLDVEQLSVDGHADVTHLFGSLRLNGQRVDVKATTAALESVAAGASTVPVDLVLAIDGASARAKGTVGAGEQAGQFDLAVAAEVTALAGLSRLLATEVHAPLPLTVTARFRKGRDGYVLDPLELSAAGQSIGGRARFTTSAARPFLDASLRSASLDLGRLMGPVPARSEPAGSTSPRRLFSDQPLPLGRPVAVDARLEVRVSRLTLPNAVALQALHFVLAANDRRLEVSRLTFTLAGGALAGRLAVATTPSGDPSVHVKLEGAGIRLEELAAAVGRTGQVSGGDTSVALNVVGAGRSLRDLAATADGDVRIVTGPARLAVTALDVAGDILTKVFDTINPFRKSEPVTELRCAVARLPVRAGVIKIERSVAYETSKINVVVAGLVDLREETLDLAIRPSPTQGLRVGLGSLAELVRLTGPLTAPRIGLDTLGAARQAVSIGAAVATGGLSLLGEGLLKGAVDDPHPCQTALAPPAPGKPAPLERAKGLLRDVVK